MMGRSPDTPNPLIPSLSRDRRRPWRSLDKLGMSGLDYSFNALVTHAR